MNAPKMTKQKLKSKIDNNKMDITKDNDKFENFSFEIMNKMMMKDCRQYITKYFIPLTNGKHAFIVDGGYIIYSERTIKNVYFNRMPDDLTKYYFYHYYKLRTPVIEKDKPMLYDDKFNMLGQYDNNNNKINNITIEKKDHK